MTSSTTPDLELPDPQRVSVDLDGELQLGRLQRMFADGETKPVPYRQWQVEALLGAGGMGRVYLARHIELGRRVAIKLVSPAPGADEEARAQRVIREAQALASVKHENVLAVYQVDTSGERTVIEMEYVEGTTLRDWQFEPGRSWRAIVEAYVRAGDGLAAIHAADLVHRDIKPDNLLVDANGCVKVADLGLAIAARRGREDVDESVGEPAVAGVLGLPLTAAGGLVGTHGYMAPEVIAGDEASAASDQFSLAVSLYEAVYGTRPFVGTTPRELAEAMRSKSLAEPRVDAWRPRWLRRCLARALSFEPSQRYPSIASFVAQLRRRLHLRRSLFGAGAAFVLLSGVGTAAWIAKPPPPDPCAGIEHELTAVWGPERRRAILTSTGTTGATDRALQLLATTLDGRVDGWTDTRLQLCASEHAHQQQAPGSIEARLDAQQHACLRYTRRHLETLIDALAREGSGLSSRYAELAEAADSLPSCTQRREHAAEIVRDDESDEKLSEALTAEVTGDYERAIALARDVADYTEERDPFRHVQALYRLGRGLGLARRDPEALAVLEQARNDAFMLGHDELMCRVSAFEAKLAAGILHDPVVARGKLEFAEACATRVQASSLLLQAELFEACGLLALAADAPSQAVTCHLDALDTRVELLGAEHPAVARAKLNLANALSATDTPDHAHIRRLYLSAIELREISFGLQHPEVAHALFDIGDYDRLRGEFELARISLERAEQIYAQVDGTDPRTRLKLQIALAHMALTERRVPEARVQLERAAAVDVGELDVRLEHATFRYLEGVLALEEADFSRAAATLRRARILHERLDPGGPAALDCMALEIEASQGNRDFARVVALAQDGGPELRARLESFGPEACGAIAWYAAEALIDAGEAELARAYLELAQRSYIQLGDADSSKQLQRLLTTLDTDQTTRP